MKMRIKVTSALATAAAAALVCLDGPGTSRAQPPIRGLTSDVGFDQKLGTQVSLDLRFRDESDRETPLGAFFGKRPVILALVYYRCPLLCNQVLSGLTRSLKPLSQSAGRDFEVVAVSFNPDESSGLASQKKKAYLDLYDRPGREGGWHFLVGDESPIGELCRTVGFRYQYNPQTRLYAHASGIVILTPEGRIARYFYGIEYPSKELRNELKRAASGRIGSPIAHLLLFCYDYDAATGKYTLSIVRIIRVLGSLTGLALASFLGVMFWRDRRGRPEDQALCERERSDPLATDHA
jgi:protein SCO1